MENKILAAGAAFLLFAGLLALANPALAYPSMGTGNDTSTTGLMSDKSMFGNTTIAADNGTKMMGMITSIQNNAQGQPAWLVGGHWKLSYTSDDTGTAAAAGSNTTGLSGMTNAGNMTAGNTTTAASNTISNITDFHAMLQMVMLDGSAMHTHEISNFTQLEDAAVTGNSTTIVGTSTVTMREGPVNDVGTRITISQDNVIKIELDPTALDNHFGDTPIYGLVMGDDMMMMGMHMGTMTSGMHMNGSMWESGNTTTSTTQDMWK